MMVEFDDFLLAQMFCLRNGVRTRREEEEEEADESFRLCVSFLAPPLSTLIGANPDPAYGSSYPMF